MNKLVRLILSALILLTVCLAPVAAADVTVYADNSPANVDDANLYAEAGYKDYNAGSDGAFDLIWLSGLGQDVPVFRFNTLPSVAASNVVSARLGVYVYGLYWNAGAFLTAHLREPGGPWAENAVTWNNCGFTDRLYFYDHSAIDTQVIASTGWVWFDCTALAKQWLGGGANNGVMLATAEYQEGSKARMASSDNADSSMRPQLEITYNTKMPTASTVYADNSPTNVDDAGVYAYPGDRDLNSSDWGTNDLIWYSGYGQESPVFRFNTLPNVMSSDVASARLGVYVAGLYWGEDPVMTAHLRDPGAAWAEDTLTYNTCAYSGQLYQYNRGGIDTQMISSTGWVWFDCTTLAKQWLDGAPNYGMLLATAEYSQGSKARFATSDSSDTSIRPKLEFTCYSATTEALPNSPADVDDTGVYAEYDAGPPPWEGKEYNAGSDPTFDLIWISGKGQDAPLYRFNTLPSVQPSEIYEAKLGVYVTGLYWNAGSQVTAHLQEPGGVWAENTLTYNNCPFSAQLTWPSGTGIDTQLITSTGWVWFDCTSLLRKWVGGSPNNGMLLATADYQQGSKARIASSDNPDPSIRPKLWWSRWTAPEASLLPAPSTEVLPGRTWNNTTNTQKVYDFAHYRNLTAGDITLTYTCDLRGATTGASGIPGYASVGMSPWSTIGTTQEQIWTNTSAVYGETNPIANIQINPTNNNFGTSGQELFNYRFSGAFPGTFSEIPLTCTDGWQQPSDSVHNVEMKLHYVDGVNNVCYVKVDGNPQLDVMGYPVGYSFPGTATELYLFHAWDNSGAWDKGTVIIGDITVTQESSALPVTVASIKEISDQADGTKISLTVPVVATANSSTFSDGRLYVESDRVGGSDGPTGIMVTRGSGVGAIALGDRITFTGTVSSDANGEKYVAIESINSQVGGSSATPLGMTNKAVAAPQPPVKGLLVTVWGKVTFVATDGSYALLDDGSGIGTRVVLNGLAAPVTKNITGKHVAVSGLVGKTVGGVDVIRPRGDGDISITSP